MTAAKSALDDREKHIIYKSNKAANPVEKETPDHVLRDNIAPTRASAVDFHELVRILKRNIYLIAATAILGLAMAATAISVIKPVYTSDIAIVFGADSRPVLDLRAALTGQPQDEAAILSEIDVIKSRTLASRLVTRLNLTEDPGFNDDIREKGYLSSLLHNILPQHHNFAPPPAAAGDENRVAHVDQKVIENVIDRIDARHVPRSRTVTVSFRAHEPEIAASVLNAIADLYLVARLEDQLESAKRAGAWLSEQLGELKDEVLQAEQAVSSYRNEHRLYRTGDGGILDRQIVDLTLKLNEVAAARQTAEANMADARRLLNSPDGALESASAILNSPVVQRFREEELALGRNEAELREELGARHPQMVQLQAEKQALQGKLKIEVQRIVSGLENDVEVAKARENAIIRDVENLKEELREENRAAVGLQSLERTLEARRLLLDRFMAAFGEARAQESLGSQVPYARVVSRAMVPDEPSFPPGKLILLIALVGFALVGAGLALVREYLDDSFRSAEQVESASGVPVLAHVPLVPRSRMRGEDLSTYLLHHPLSPFFDAVHSVSTSIMFGHLGKAPRVVLVSSAVAGEGKTTLALALGRQLSQNGKRVALVEADFRRPQIAERVKGLAPSPGLREVLAGVASTNGVLQEDRASGMKVLVSGVGGPEPFSFQKLGLLKTVIEQLRTEYDLVILDSPPVTALVDASILSRCADATIMVVAWGKTPAKVFSYALQQARRSGGRILGVVLSKVDVKQQANYGYGDSGRYHRDAAKYYTHS